MLERVNNTKNTKKSKENFINKIKNLLKKSVL